MNRYIYILTSWLLALAVNTNAQSYKNRDAEIVLRDGSTLSITAGSYDSIRVLNNLVLNGDGEIGIKIYISGEKSTDYIAQSIVFADDNKNENRNIGKATRLEFPKLSADTVMNLLISHDTDAYGNTYSLEWDCKKKANRWTVYEMYDGNSLKNVSRQDDFREDEQIPAEYRTTLADYSGSGFSRGHLCPSSDRLCSREQNSQTFYLSNMQPQWQNHNGILWNNLEQQLTNTWNTSDFRDTLYVVKAATIDDDHIKEYTKSGLIVPAYFYMAILAVKDGKYKAIGLWTEHENVSITNRNYGDYAVSIDELEELTGIDFFCNLPDSIEDEVESSYSLTEWGISKTSN